MPANSERSFNEALARVLRTKHPRWRRDLTAEQHRAVRGGGQPDLIVRDPRGAPVVVEAECAPARTVEQDAVARLGRVLADSGDAVEQCLALRAPVSLRHTPQAALDEQTARATFEYSLFSRAGDGGGPVRWPGAGPVGGGVDDLAAVIESASVSERVVSRSLDPLERGIAEAAVRLREATADRPDVKRPHRRDAAPGGRRADVADGDGHRRQRAHLPDDAGRRPRRADARRAAPGRRAAEVAGAARVGTDLGDQLLADLPYGWRASSPFPGGGCCRAIMR